MKLIQESSKLTVSNNIYPASSFLDVTFGLIFKKNTDLFFKTRFGIHTFAMKNDIDVLILDNKFKVVKIKSLKPNRIFIWNPFYQNVIELRRGTVEKFKVGVGDKLSLI